MIAEKKTMTIREIENKIVDLKIELLKNVTKRKSIKKEIARLLTMENQTKSDGGSPLGVPKKKGGNK